MEMGVMAGLTQAVVGYGLTIVVASASAGMIWLVVYVLDHLHNRREAALKAASPVQVNVAVEPVAEIEDETPYHVAAVAAAVYAAIGASRLVQIGSLPSGAAWTTTGRALHQTSHLPKRAPKK